MQLWGGYQTDLAIPVDINEKLEVGEVVGDDQPIRTSYISVYL